MKYDYTVARTADENVFVSQYDAISKRFPLEKTLRDVDGSEIHTFSAGNDCISVYLDYDVDETILIDALKDLDLIKSYLYEGVEIFAYDYAELIDALRLCDL